MLAPDDAANRPGRNLAGIEPRRHGDHDHPPAPLATGLVRRRRARRRAPRAVRPRRPHRHAADLPARPRDAFPVDPARPRHPDGRRSTAGSTTRAPTSWTASCRAPTTSRSRPTTSAALGRRRLPQDPGPTPPARHRTVRRGGHHPRARPDESGTRRHEPLRAVFREHEASIPSRSPSSRSDGCVATRRSVARAARRRSCGTQASSTTRRHDRGRARRRDRPHRRPDDGPRRVADARHDRRLRRLRRALRPLQRDHRSSRSTSTRSASTTSPSPRRTSSPFGAALRDRQPDSDLMTNLQWCCETNLFATEALAEYLDIELPTVEMPEPRDSRGSRRRSSIWCGACVGRDRRRVPALQGADDVPARPSPRPHRRDR